MEIACLPWGCGVPFPYQLILSYSVFSSLGTEALRGEVSPKFLPGVDAELGHITFLQGTWS